MKPDFMNHLYNYLQGSEFTVGQCTVSKTTVRVIHIPPVLPMATIKVIKYDHKFLLGLLLDFE